MKILVNKDIIYIFLINIYFKHTQTANKRKTFFYNQFVRNFTKTPGWSKSLNVS